MEICSKVLRFSDGYSPEGIHILGHGYLVESAFTTGLTAKSLLCNSGKDKKGIW